MAQDVDTVSKIVLDNIGKYLGRKEIVINASPEEFRANVKETIEKNLGKILAIHKINVNQINYLIDYTKGVQDIEGKTRANENDKINNKVVTNYAWEFVNFKKGYYVGNPIKYVVNSTDDNDKLKYINMYNKSRKVSKSSKDINKYENLLIYGIAHTMVTTTQKSYDTEKDSPYDYTVLDDRNVCSVKSNDIFKTKLFDMYISTITGEDNKYYQLYTIYYDDNFIYFTNRNNKLVEWENAQGVSSGKFPVSNPITEYKLNQYCMGIFECELSTLNSLNKIRSNQIDLLEEVVNKYLTFENVDFSDIYNNIDDMRNKRILVVNTNNPNTPAKIGSVTLDNDSTTTNSTYKDMEQRAYDVIGVPMPTSNTGQGVSGEAQQYGGGWENAQSYARIDTEYIKQFEKEDLEKMIDISNNALNSKTIGLNVNDVEIKYTINKSNNMQVKAQSFKYLVDYGIPTEQALEICELTDDPYSVAKLTDENIIGREQRVVDLEIEKQKKINELNKDNSNEDSNQQ